MKNLILLAMLLLTTSTQAGVFKCKTPNGFTYSEKPCPEGATAGPLRVIPASGDPISKAPTTELPTKTDEVAGKPYPPITDKQRPAYEKHMSKPNPKAFVICNDKRVISLVGKGNFVQKQLASLEAGCTPYSIDDTVVWTK